MHNSQSSIRPLTYRVRIEVELRSGLRIVGDESNYNVVRTNRESIDYVINEALECVPVRTRRRPSAYRCCHVQDEHYVGERERTQGRHYITRNKQQYNGVLVRWFSKLCGRHIWSISYRF